MTNSNNNVDSTAAKQCLLVYLVLMIVVNVSSAATHWIVTEDGKIHTQDESTFQMRRPYDLMSLLQQEKRSNEFDKIKSQLMAQKEEIESYSFAESDDDVEELVYLTNSDCNLARKQLIHFDLYVGTLVFLYPRSPEHRAFPENFPVSNLHTNNLSDRLGLSGELADHLNYYRNKNLVTITSSNTSATFTSKTGENGDEWTSSSLNVDNEPLSDKIKYAPNCSDYLTLDFSMTTFEHLPSVRDRKQLQIDPEKEIFRIIGKWKNYQSFGRDISNGLNQNSSSWILYTLASFFWRGVGNAEQSIECVRRALHTSPYEYRPIALLSLATILHRARSFEEAAIVLHGAIDITPDIPHTHYTLGNIYAVLADYNKSVICYENVLKLCPKFTEAKVRKHAVLCHSNIENALRLQHDTLQKSLDELKDFQRQKELWASYHSKLRSEQAPTSTMLEQRLHYREFKMRQQLESTFDDALKKKQQQQQSQNNESTNNNSKKQSESQKRSTTTAGAAATTTHHHNHPKPEDSFVNNLSNKEQLSLKLNSIADKSGQNLLNYYIELEKDELDDDSQDDQPDGKQLEQLKHRLEREMICNNGEESGDEDDEGEEDDVDEDGNNRSKSSPPNNRQQSNQKQQQSDHHTEHSKSSGSNEAGATTSTSSECNSRPILIPVTFVLPPPA